MCGAGHIADREKTKDDRFELESVGVLVGFPIRFVPHHIDGQFFSSAAIL